MICIITQSLVTQKQYLFPGAIEFVLIRMTVSNQMNPILKSHHQENNKRNERILSERIKKQNNMRNCVQQRFIERIEDDWRGRGRNDDEEYSILYDVRLLNFPITFSPPATRFFSFRSIYFSILFYSHNLFYSTLLYMYHTHTEKSSNPTILYCCDQKKKKFKCWGWFFLGW